MCDSLFDKRIDQLTAVSPSLLDLLPIYDVSDPNTRKITIQQLASLLSLSVAIDRYEYTSLIEQTTITVPELAGCAKVLSVWRGGSNVSKIITGGTPSGNQVSVNLTTGALTVHADNKWQPDEEISGMFK